ncbi:PP2C family protein-serine/threonine phosphatase [Streptomyces longisporoflavus]|uniref:PP2C family protein-serine/threonine phosphatase n=1 Tax=Streptomyces longisporoflavus TaxID=28044 RepID=A0ABW7QZ59_9ACTN
MRRWHSRNSLLALALGGTLLLAALGTSVSGWPTGVAVLLIGPMLTSVWSSVRRTAVVTGWTFLLASWAGLVRRLVASPAFGLEFLVLVAGGMLAVRNAARHAEHKAALARATEVASASQSALMQPLAVEVGGIEVCSRQHSPVQGASVCGDLYDVVRTSYGTRLIVGDVRGHGLEALRITAVALRAFRDLAHVAPGLADLATAMDARLAPDLGPEDFVTAVFAEFAPGEVRLVNCGHPPPLRVGKRVRLLEPPEPTPPLGLCTEPPAHRVYLQPGERLLFYTDGLSEARDGHGVEFPLLPRVAEALAEPSNSDALDALYGLAIAHTGRPLTDDVVLVLCRATGVTEAPYAAWPREGISPAAGP